MNKYKNKKITYNGIVYDSKKEMKRHIDLMELEKRGEITDLQRQVKFVLIPAQREPYTIGKRGGVRKGKLLEKECSYLADFTYKDHSRKLHVEDVKGYRGGGAYAVFTIKRKLMLYIHGIRIKEV